MKIERAYLNYDEGQAMCCWESPSRESLENLFNEAGVPFERILQVEEYDPDSFAA